jgi:hypothetical protein
VLSGVVGGIVSWNVRPVAPAFSGPVARLELPIEAPMAVMAAQPGLELSPDGAFVAYVAGRPGSKLYLRELASSRLSAVAEFEDADSPFFSHDSQSLAFFRDGKMHKVSVRGGAPIALANSPRLRGATWGEQGFIAFAPNARTGLFQIPASGGPPEMLTTPDPRVETSHTNAHWCLAARPFSTRSVE